MESGLPSKSHPFCFVFVVTFFCFFCLKNLNAFKNCDLNSVFFEDAKCDDLDQNSHNTHTHLHTPTHLHHAHTDTYTHTSSTDSLKTKTPTPHASKQQS
jgi:hypothetical protein